MFVGIGSGLVGGGVQASIQSLLFGLGEPGVLFDPTDLTTMYVDRAGTTPVTAAGQSVGLRLSKDQGLRQGPERVANGSFHSDLSGWTLGSDAAQVIAIWTASGASLTRGAGGPNGFTQTGVAQVGKTYLITFDVVSGTAAFDAFGVSVVAGGAGSKRFIYVASTTSIQFWPTANNATVVIDNISVRELAGNHEVAVSDAKRGVYGWMPKTGRRNLLTYTEQFDNAAWVKTDATVTANAAVAPDETLTADLQIISAQFGGASQFYSGLSTGAAYTVSVWARVDSGSRVYSVVDNSGGGGILGTFTPTTSWVRYNFPLTAGSSSATIFIAQDRSASGFSGVYLWGAQLEVGSTATAYQRVASQYDITEAGVPTCYYVQADGVDDAYVTPTITPNTDKVQVFAGLRKLSDAAGAGIFLENSAGIGTNNGVFGLTAPLNSTGMTFGFGSKGTLFSGWATSGASFTAPVYAVITGIGDIASDTQILRANGIQVATTTTDQGTGNYLSYPVYIYSRGGTSLPFNGLDFGHAVRFGSNLDAATIARVESLIARNTPEVTL